MEKIMLKNRRSQNIVGVLTKPQMEIIGTAVLQHGYGGTKEQKHMIVLQDVFLNCGFQVFNFDSPNSFGESDGEYKNARLGLHADDFEDVANWTQEQDWFSGKLLVSGHSMGGFSAARYLLRNPEKVFISIPFAPVISGELSFAAKRKFYPELFKKWEQNGVQIRKSASISGRIMEEPWGHMLERLNHSLLTENNESKKILIIGCELDKSVPCEYLKIFYDSLLGDKKISILKKTTHTPKKDSQLKELREIVISWLKKKI